MLVSSFIVDANLGKIMIYTFVAFLLLDLYWF